MEFTYFPGQKKSWELDTRQLRHRYFVQLAPDQEHLVLGMVQQGTRPPTGRWLELGTILRKLPERYFVQQTSFNTLVPGLLIQSDTPPGNTWKDIQSRPMFHVITFQNPPYNAFDIATEYTFTNNQDFIDEIVNPALDEIYPNRDQEKSVRLQLYFFWGNYTYFVNDTTLLTPFATTATPADLGYFATGSSTYTNIFENTTTEPANLTIKPEANVGTYSIILAVVNDDDEIIDYIFLDEVLYYFLPG